MNAYPIFPSVLSLSISKNLGTESPLILFPCGCALSFESYIEQLANF